MNLNTISLPRPITKLVKKLPAIFFLETAFAQHWIPCGMGFLWSSVAFPLPNLVELPLYGFVGEEIERYGYQGIAPWSQGTHYSASANLQKLWQPVSSILFPSLSWCFFGLFCFQSLSVITSVIFFLQITLSLSLLLSQHECPTL
jgi:hypothetical protein